MSQVTEIRKRLGELRTLFLRATPEQRYDIARDRLNNPRSPVNQLIHLVGAVEGFARSIAIDLGRRKGITPDDAYPLLRYPNAVDLIADHIAPATEKTPADLFGSDDWELFMLAVDFRNFLVHEAASLREGYSRALNDACDRVLRKLAQVAGVSP